MARLRKSCASRSPSRKRRKENNWVPPFFLYMHGFRKSMPGRPMQEVAKEASNKWKTLTSEEKYKYIKESQKLGEGVVGYTLSRGLFDSWLLDDPQWIISKPKRKPISPFILYFVRFRKSMVGKQMKEVAKEAGRTWNMLTQEEKLQYSQLSLALWRKEELSRSDCSHRDRSRGQKITHRYRRKNRSARRSLSRRRYPEEPNPRRSTRRSLRRMRSGRRSRSSRRSINRSDSRRRRCRRASNRTKVRPNRSAYTSRSRWLPISKRYTARRSSASRNGRTRSTARRRKMTSSSSRKRNGANCEKRHEDNKASEEKISESEKSGKSEEGKCKPENPENKPEVSLTNHWDSRESSADSTAQILTVDVPRE